MLTTDIRRRMDALVERTADGRSVHGLVASMSSADGLFDWVGAAGDLSPESLFFIASTTKLYTTALVLGAADRGHLRLDDPIARYLPERLLRGIHTLRGVDHVPALTVRHLLAHTSGLPDYFQQKRAHGRSLEQELMAGQDVGWDVAQVLEDVRSMKPAFAPGTPGKAPPDLMRFLRAFFDGTLFARTHLPLIQRPWNRIFFPMQYGVGLMRFKLPWIFSPFRSTPEFVGHSGLSGAFAFLCPARGMFLCGTVNQLTPPSLSFRLMLKLVNEAAPN